MSDQTLRLLIGGALFVHGVGHTLGFWMPTNSWILRGVPEPSLRVISSVFWVLSAIGFVAAAGGFFGILVPAAWWRTIALAMAIVSLIGLVTFIGNWPASNTVGAIGMNITVLVALLVKNWPPQTLAP